MESFDMKTVKCTGDARSMGRQYGEQAREDIAANAEAWRISSQTSGASGFVARVRAVLTARVPEVLEEIEGIAEGCRLSADAVLLLNAQGAPIPSSCTSMAISGGSDGPVLGKNNDGDFEPDGLRFVVRSSEPSSGIPMVQVTYAGWLSGLDAVNREGLANGHNSVGSIFDRSGDRIDIRLWTYRLMRRCKTVGELVRGMTDAPLSGKGFNIVVADGAGGTAVLEAAVPVIECRNLGDEFVYATNHYTMPPVRNADQRPPIGKEVSVLRYGYLRWRAEVDPPGNAKAIADILKSHEPWAPCRHGGPHISKTLWSMICTLRSRTIMVAAGPPCESSYQSFPV